MGSTLEREPPTAGGQGLAKKGSSLLRPGTVVRHRCITTLAKKASVRRVCDLVEVNRSGYYAARQRRRRRPPCALGQRVQEVFEQSQWTYGSRRVLAALRSEGKTVGRCRVHPNRLVSLAIQSRVWCYEKLEEIYLLMRPARRVR